MGIKGENSIIYIHSGAAYKPIACLTSNSLQSTLSVIESTTKCYPGVVKKTPGTFSASIGLEGEYIDTTTAGGDTAKQSHDALFALQKAKTVVEWKIDTDITNANSVKYYGNAIITDLNADFGSGNDLSKFSATLDVDGDVVTTDPNA